MLPTSVDSLGSHVELGKGVAFPVRDDRRHEGRARDEVWIARRGPADFRRTVFVIGKDGKIAYADTRFNALAQDGYDKLAAAIKSAKGN